MKLKANISTYTLFIFLIIVLFSHPVFSAETDLSLTNQNNKEGATASGSSADEESATASGNSASNASTKSGVADKTSVINRISGMSIFENILADGLVFAFIFILALIGWKKHITPENIQKFLQGRVLTNSEHIVKEQRIIEKNKLVEKNNFTKEKLTDDDLIKELISTKSILKKWDRQLDKPITFYAERFFASDEDSFTKQKIAHELVKRFQNDNISAIIVLPFEREGLSSPIPHITKVVENGLKDGRKQLVRLVLTKHQIEKEHLTQLNDFNESDGILLIQPVAKPDMFVSEVVNYLSRETPAKIKGIVTIFDSNVRSTVPGEDILIKLNLNQYES